MLRPFLMLAVSCWICSLLGAAVSYVVLLGNAMSTVPIRLSVRLALALSVLPAIGLGLGYLGVSSAFTANIGGRGLLIYTVPILAAFAASVGVILELSCNWLRHRRSEPRQTTERFSAEGNLARYRLEIRAAQTSASDALMRTNCSGVDGALYVSNQVLISNSDLEFTWVRGPGSDGSYELGLGLNDAAAARLSALPAPTADHRWALYIDDQIVAAPQLPAGVQREMGVSGLFDRAQATCYAQGVMRA